MPGSARVVGCPAMPPRREPPGSPTATVLAGGCMLPPSASSLRTDCRWRGGSTQMLSSRNSGIIALAALGRASAGSTQWKSRPLTGAARRAGRNARDARADTGAPLGHSHGAAPGSNRAARAGGESTKRRDTPLGSLLKYLQRFDTPAMRRHAGRARTSTLQGEYKVHWVLFGRTPPPPARPMAVTPSAAWQARLAALCAPGRMVGAIVAEARAPERRRRVRLPRRQRRPVHRARRK